MIDRLKLVRPCPDCPFRVDIPGYLRPGRMADILATMLADDYMLFPCHTTMERYEDEESGQLLLRQTAATQVCVGSLLFLLSHNSPPVQIRIAQMLDHWQPEQLDTTAAEIGATAAELEEHHARTWR